MDFSLIEHWDILADVFLLRLMPEIKSLSACLSVVVLCDTDIIDAGLFYRISHICFFMIPPTEATTLGLLSYPLGRYLLRMWYLCWLCYDCICFAIILYFLFLSFVSFILLSQNFGLVCICEPKVASYVHLPCNWCICQKRRRILWFTGSNIFCVGFRWIIRFLYWSCCLPWWMNVVERGLFLDLLLPCFSCFFYSTLPFLSENFLSMARSMCSIGSAWPW